MTKEKFVKFLEENRFYKKGLNWAKAQVSARDIIEKCPEVQYLDWLIRDIEGPLLDEYNKKLATLWSEYYKNVAPFRDEYDKQVTPILAEYYKKHAINWAEYKDKEAIFWDEYDKQAVPFRAEYDKKVAVLIREICTFERVCEAIC